MAEREPSWDDSEILSKSSSSENEGQLIFYCVFILALQITIRHFLFEIMMWHCGIFFYAETAVLLSNVENDNSDHQ